MKHWDGRDLADAELRLPRHDEVRLVRDLRPPARRRESPHIGSVIGLVLAVGMLAGIALMLAAPGDPVSTKVLH